MINDAEFKSLNSPQLSKKEEITLNKIVDLLLKGRRIRNIASCMIPKLDYILNIRLQDAINRGFHQSVSVLQRHIQNLHDISQMRTYFQNSKTEDDINNEQNSDQYEKKTLELTNKLLNEMKKMNLQEQEQFLQTQETVFEEMQEFYRRKRREIENDYNNKRNILLKRFRTERKELYDTFSQKKKHFKFSKTIEDKKALILILKQRNRLLTDQALSSPYTSLSKRQLKEADVVAESTIQKHENELQELMKNEKKQHEESVEALYNENLNKMIEKQKETSKRMMQLFEFRRNENEKSRKRDISEILLTISIIKNNIGKVMASPSKQMTTLTDQIELSPIQQDLSKTKPTKATTNSFPSNMTPITELTPLSPINDKKQFVSTGNQTNTPPSPKMTPVEMLSTSAIRAFEEEEENIEPKRYSIERNRSLSKSKESKIIEFQNVHTQTNGILKTTGTSTKPPTSAPSQTIIKRSNRSASVSNSRRRTNHPERNATRYYEEPDYRPRQRNSTFTQNYEAPEYRPVQRNSAYEQNYEQPEYRPVQRNSSYSRNYEEPEYRQVQRNSGYAQNYEEPDYRPRQRNSFTQNYEQPEHRPRRRNSTYAQNYEQPEYRQKQRNATFTQNYEQPEHPQQRRMPSFIPEFNRKFKSTLIPPSYGYADMNMITSIEDENGVDYSGLYPLEPRDNTELEVTTKFVELKRHKFY